MKTVVDGGAHVGWATLYQPNICAECWADKALAQPTRWPFWTVLLLQITSQKLSSTHHLAYRFVDQILAAVQISENLD